MSQEVLPVVRFQPKACNIPFSGYLNKFLISLTYHLLNMRAIQFTSTDRAMNFFYRLMVNFISTFLLWRPGFALLFTKHEAQIKDSLTAKI